MKKSTKKLAVSVLITSTMVTMAANVYAADTTTMAENDCAAEPVGMAYVQVGDNDCVVEYELHITEIDGEEYVVIDLNDFASDDVNISNNNSALNQENYSLLSTLDNKRKLYSDTVNLTNGDYSTPVLDCNPSTGFIIRSLSARFADNMKLCMHTYSTAYNGWEPSPKTILLVFNAMFPERDLGVMVKDLLTKVNP